MMDALMNGRPLRTRMCHYLFLPSRFLCCRLRCFASAHAALSYFGVMEYAATPAAIESPETSSSDFSACHLSSNLLYHAHRGKLLAPAHASPETSHPLGGGGQQLSTAFTALGEETLRLVMTSSPAPPQSTTLSAVSVT